MKATKLIHHFGLLILLLGVGLAGMALTALGQEKSDAIAIRVVANPERLSISQWYTNEGIEGSPQSMIVDGYEAIRNNRTVYVAAANIANFSLINDYTPAGLAYSNIYIITYSQGSGTITEDIFGKILSKWRFNTNLQPDYGFCLKELHNIPSSDPYLNKLCQADSECGDYKCQDDRCRPEFSCRLDSDCYLGSYCSSNQAKIIRDLDRYQTIVELKNSLDNYKKLNGHYPLLNSGTYLPRVAMSVWPSWQSVFTTSIGATAAVDPVNKLGNCDGFDDLTCWSAEKKLFYASSTVDNLVLPADSRAIVYRTTAASGASYKLCAGMETSLNIIEDGQTVSLDDFNCDMTASLSTTNQAPSLVSSSLTGQTGQEFKGYVIANDPEEELMSFSLVDQNTYSTWAKTLVIKATTDPKQKMLYAPNSGNPGTHNIKLAIADSLGNTTVVPLTITINSAPVSVAAESSDYNLNPLVPLNYNIYFEAADLSSIELTFSQTLSLIKKALAVTASTSADPYDLSCASPNSSGPWVWNITADLEHSKVINNCLSASLHQEAQNKYRLNITGVVKGYAQTGTAYFNYSLKLNKITGLGSATIARAKIKINQNLPVLDLRCSRKAVLNKQYNCQVINVNNVPIKEYSLATSSPDGLNISSSTGKISGVPLNIGDFKMNISALSYYNGLSSISYDLNVASQCGRMLVQYAGGPWNIDGTVKNQGGYYRTILIGDQCWLRDNLNVSQWSRVDEATATCPAGTANAGSGLGDVLLDSEANSSSEENNSTQMNRISSFLARISKNFIAQAQLDSSTTRTTADSIGRCYAGLDNFCYAEGRLYTFEEATASSAASSTSANVQGICPSGWHVPTDTELKSMEETLGVPSNELNNTGFRGIASGIYHKLKLEGDSGFDALLTGVYTFDSGTRASSATNHDRTYFWSSSFSTDHIITRDLINTNDGISRQAIFSPNKEYAPLRCIMDKPCAENCAAPQYCNSSGICANACVADCSGKTCGNNGCGGSCGMCGTTDECSGGQCVANADKVNDACSGTR